MKKRTAELILKDPEKFAHHDRVFLNNPVVMQGMGSGTAGGRGYHRAERPDAGGGGDAAAGALRVLACLLSRLVPLRDEEPTPEQLQKSCCPAHFCTQPAPLWCTWRHIPF